MAKDLKDIHIQLSDLISKLEDILQDNQSKWLVSDLNVLSHSVAAKACQLEINEERLNLVIESTGVGIWDWDITSGETVFNERWADIIGYTLEELQPISIDTWLKYAHPDDLVESNRLLQKHWDGDSDYYIFESRMKHRDGRWVWVLDTGKVVEWDSCGNPVRMTGTHLDISEQKEAIAALEKQKRLVERQSRQLTIANARLRRLSEIDPVTSIPNRMVYERTLEQEVQAARRAEVPLSYLMIDIDDFKLYNDNYGHAKGDDVLHTVAQRIQELLMRSTDFVARYGGEEFVVLLPYTDSVSALYVAEKIRKAVQIAYIEHKYSTVAECITLSIGVATETGQTIDKKRIAEDADQAMYTAKHNGKNRCALSHYS